MGFHLTVMLLPAFLSLHPYTLLLCFPILFALLLLWETCFACGGTVRITAAFVRVDSQVANHGSQFGPEQRKPLAKNDTMGSPLSWPLDSNPAPTTLTGTPDNVVFPTIRDAQMLSGSLSNPENCLSQIIRDVV